MQIVGICVLLAAPPRTLLSLVVKEVYSHDWLKFTGGGAAQCLVVKQAEQFEGASALHFTL